MLSATVTLAASLQNLHRASAMQLWHGASHGVDEGSSPLMEREVELLGVGESQARCPPTCKCSSSGGPDGLAVNAEGFCTGACSQPYTFGLGVTKRFCGDGEHYRLGDFEDCTGCSQQSSAKSSPSPTTTLTTLEFEEFAGKCRGANQKNSKYYMYTSSDMDQASCEPLCSKNWCQAYAYGPSNGKCILYPASVDTDPGIPDGPGWFKNDKSIISIMEGNGDDKFRCMKRTQEFEEFSGKCLGKKDDKPTYYWKEGVLDQLSCELLCSKHWCQAYTYGQSNTKCYLYPASAETDPGTPDAPGWTKQNNNGILQVTHGNAKLTSFKCMKRIN